MKKSFLVHFMFLAVLFLSGCGASDSERHSISIPDSAPVSQQPDSRQPIQRVQSLVEARAKLKTTILKSESKPEPIQEPPPELFQVVHYDSSVGKLAAYLTPDPKDGKKHPAIIWITGGDCNTVGNVWDEKPIENDQSASAYRQAGLVMMFPSLRGGNENPGDKESFLGEVDDVIAARDFLSKQPYVDPDRIYLGGHSTGGTLVLLVAECTDRFRAVFSFGPIDDATYYGPQFSNFDVKSIPEREARAPILWLHCIKSPVFVFEGAIKPARFEEVQYMQKANTNPMVHFYLVGNADHWTILAPLNLLIATKCTLDTRPTCNLSFSDVELSTLFAE